jgi:hypothetical protein
MVSAKPGTLSHGEVQDVKEIMDGLCSIALERDCKIHTVEVTLDTGKPVVIAFNVNDDFEVSLV